MPDSPRPPGPWWPGHAGGGRHADLTQAASADRVLVLGRGRVVELGPHAELVAAGGTYAALLAAWSRGA